MVFLCGGECDATYPRLTTLIFRIEVFRLFHVPLHVRLSPSLPSPPCAERPEGNAYHLRLDTTRSRRTARLHALRPHGPRHATGKAAADPCVRTPRRPGGRNVSRTPPPLHMVCRIGMPHRARRRWICPAQRLRRAGGGKPRVRARWRLGPSATWGRVGQDYGWTMLGTRYVSPSEVRISWRLCSGRVLIGW